MKLMEWKNYASYIIVKKKRFFDFMKVAEH